MTFEEGRIRTCRFPDFSALLMALSASFWTPSSQYCIEGELSGILTSTLVLTIFAVGDSQFVVWKRGICK